MAAQASRLIRSLAALVVSASAVLLFGCGEQAPTRSPAAPDGHSVSASHEDGVDGDAADDVKVIEDNISGGGSEVCNDSRVQDSGIVGDDEGTWSGQKVDPPEDVENNGFVLDVKGKKTLDWTDDGDNLMQAVLIKAGASSVVYYYNEGNPEAEPDPIEDSSDSKLDGEDDKEISHYVYCFVPQPAVKRGVKLDDADGDGEIDSEEDRLPGWEIRAYADDGDGKLSPSEFDAGAVATTSTADGSGRLEKGHYEFRLEPGDYVVCEVLQAGWNQSSGPSDTDDDACAAGEGLADDGYGVSLSAGETDDGNHFFNNQTTIEVLVEDGQGKGVPGYSVVAIHTTNGPYRDDHSLRVGTADANGLAVITNLEAGDYCIRASPLAPTSDRLVPPRDAGEAPALAGENRGTVVTATPTDDGNDPLTVANAVRKCVDTDTKIQPGDHVTVTLRPNADAVTGTFETLEEDPGEVSAWLVESLEGAGLPKTWLDNLPDFGVTDIELGLPAAAAPDNGDPSFELQPPGGSRVESDKVAGPDGTIQTATTSVSSSGDLGTITTEPLFCVTNQISEPADDGGQVEFIGPYKVGFLADKNLALIEDAFGLSYEQTAGEAQLKVRAKAKNTKRLVVDYTCDADGNCAIDKKAGALAKRVTVTLGSKGGNRVRWVITDLPNGTSKVLSGLSAPNDQVPNASKDDNNDGLVEAALPGSCKNDQGTIGIGI